MQDVYAQWGFVELQDKCTEMMTSKRQRFLRWLPEVHMLRFCWQDQCRDPLVEGRLSCRAHCLACSPWRAVADQRSHISKILAPLQNEVRVSTGTQGSHQAVDSADNCGQRATDDMQRAISQE